MPCCSTGAPSPVSPFTPPIQPQPRVKEWIEIYDKGWGRGELRRSEAVQFAGSA